MPGMEKKRTIVTGLIFAGTLIGVLLGLRWVWGNAWQHITVSPAVTYVTAPLRPDGTVDYIAAVNDHFRAGLTRENNAAIPILERINTLQYGGYAKEAADLLGASEIAAPASAEDGRFVAYDEFRAKKAGGTVGADLRLGWTNGLQSLAGSPWQAKDRPEVAAWLDAQRDPMKAIASAAKLPRFFVPLPRKADESTVRGATSPPLLPIKAIADAFRVRAMRETGEGKTEMAAADALTAIRMGYLVGQQPTILERLVGLRIIDNGLHTVMAISEDGDLTRAQSRKLLEDLRALPPLPTFTECLDVYERYGVLDEFVELSRFGPDVGSGGAPRRAGPFAFGMMPVHFDPEMREANAWEDRLIAAASVAGFKDREAALQKVAEDARRATPELKAGSTSSQSALQSLATLGAADFRREFRERDFTQQDLNLLLAGLGALDQFASGPPGDKALAEWLGSAPGNVFTGGPLHVAQNAGSMAFSCEGPAPLPAFGFTLGGISLKGTPEEKREFHLVIRLSSP